MAPERICVENLGYGFERVAGIAPDLGLSICCDIGHLLLYGVEVDTHLDRYFPRTRVIHLHGLEGGVDHRAVSCLDPVFLECLIQRFRAAADLTRVVTIEVSARNISETPCSASRNGAGQMEAATREPAPACSLCRTQQHIGPGV